MALLYACERAVTEAQLNCPCSVPETLPSGITINDILDAASDALAVMSGSQIGRCTTAYRPCRADTCRWSCGGCGLYGIHLPGLKPTVTAVKIDGATVPTTDYTTIVTPIGHVVLERREADGSVAYWPTRQNLRAPSSAEGTFEITVTTGNEITITERLAAGELACDFLAALTDQEHLLPDGVVAATMHGVTVDFRRFSDPTDQSTMEMAGLVWLQRFLNSVGTGSPPLTRIMATEIDDGWSLYSVAA